MNIRLALLASVAVLGFSLSAQASDLSFTITGGTLVDGALTGSFTGSFLINSSNEVIDGGQFTVTTPGGPYFFSSNVATNPTIGGLETFTDGSGDSFMLALHGAIGALALNTLTSSPGGPGADTSFTNAAGARFDTTGGSIAPSPTPEPSSLMLLGTGALGLAGSFRRRFLKA